MRKIHLTTLPRLTISSFMKISFSLKIIGLVIFSAHTALGACPNGRCSASISGSGSGPVVTYLKGSNTNATTLNPITEVSGDSITVTQSKSAKTYKTDKLTQIFINGNAASLPRLNKGMLVKVDPSLIQPGVARVITATTPKS